MKYCIDRCSAEIRPHTLPLHSPLALKLIIITAIVAAICYRFLRLHTKIPRDVPVSAWVPAVLDSPHSTFPSDTGWYHGTKHVGR